MYTNCIALYTTSKKSPTETAAKPFRNWALEPAPWTTELFFVQEKIIFEVYFLHLKQKKTQPAIIEKRPEIIQSIKT